MARRSRETPELAADAGSAGVGRYGSGSKPKSPEVIMLRDAQRTSGDDGQNRNVVQTMRSWLEALSAWTRRDDEPLPVHGVMRWASCLSVPRRAMIVAECNGLRP